MIYIRIDSQSIDEAKRIGRRLIYIRNTDRKALAEYREEEFCKEDLSTIKRHSKTSYGRYSYYDITGTLFEEIRKHKLRLLQQKGIPDDGTIFGTASKEIFVPQKIIPEHKINIFVEWDCWNDNLRTDDYYKQM